MEIVMIVVAIILVLGIGLVAMHKKHHGKGGCIHNCAKMSQPLPS